MTEQALAAPDPGKEVVDQAAQAAQNLVEQEGNQTPKIQDTDNGLAGYSRVPAPNTQNTPAPSGEQPVFNTTPSGGLSLNPDRPLPAAEEQRYQGAQPPKQPEDK